MEALVTGAFVLAAAVLGYFGTTLTEDRRHQRTVERERESREAELAAERETARNAFQRETLLELQEVAQRHLRSLAVIHHADAVQSREAGEWQRFQSFRINEDENREAFDTNTRLVLLNSRVLDDELRELVLEFRTSTGPLLFVESEQEGDDLLVALGERLAGIHDRTGQLLREVYR